MKTFKEEPPDLEKNLLLKDGDDYYVGRVTDEYSEDDQELCIQNSEGAIINIYDYLEWEYIDELILNAQRWITFQKIYDKKFK